MIMTFMYLMTTMLILSILILIFYMISNNSMLNRIKFSTFECGMDILSKLRLPFSLHFYFISLIFLIFDVELFLILPLIFCMKMSLAFNMINMIITMVLILVVGFIYEWWMGMMNWMI